MPLWQHKKEFVRQLKAGYNDGDGRINDLIRIIYNQDYWGDESMESDGAKTREAALLPKLASILQIERPKFGKGLKVRKLGNGGKHHCEVHDVKIDVEFW